MPKVPKTNIGYKISKSFDHQSVGSPGLHTLVTVKGHIQSIFFPGDILPSGTQLVGNSVYIDFRISLIQGRDKAGNKSIADGEVMDVEWNNILDKNSRSDNPVVFRLTSTPQELFTSFGSKQTIERIQPVIEYTFSPTSFLSGIASIIADSRFGNGGEITPNQWPYTHNKNRSGNAIQIFSAMLNNTKIPGF